MLKSELLRIKSSTRSKMVILLVMMIPMINLLEGIYWEYLIYFPFESMPNRESMVHPCFHAFLSGVSDSQISQMLLIWLLPIYHLLVYSDEYLIDRNNNCFNLIRTRCNIKRILIMRFAISFFEGFFLVFISIMINFLLCFFLFYGGENFMGLESYSQNSGINMGINHPYYTYIAKVLMASLISGVLSMFCQSMTYIVKNIKYVYFSCSFFWIIQIISPYSITYCIQPYIEYGLNYRIPAFLLFAMASLIVIFIAYRYKVKNDEL